MWFDVIMWLEKNRGPNEDPSWLGQSQWASSDSKVFVRNITSQTWRKPGRNHASHAHPHLEAHFLASKWPEIGALGAILGSKFSSKNHGTCFSWEKTISTMFHEMNEMKMWLLWLLLTRFAKSGTSNLCGKSLCHADILIPRPPARVSIRHQTSLFWWFQFKKSSFFPNFSGVNLQFVFEDPQLIFPHVFKRFLPKPGPPRASATKKRACASVKRPKRRMCSKSSPPP